MAGRAAGIGALHSTVELGERCQRTRGREGERRVTEPLEGNMAGALKPRFPCQHNDNG